MTVGRSVIKGTPIGVLIVVILYLCFARLRSQRKLGRPWRPWSAQAGPESWRSWSQKLWPTRSGKSCVKLTLDRVSWYPWSFINCYFNAWMYHDKGPCVCKKTPATPVAFVCICRSFRIVGIEGKHFFSYFTSLMSSIMFNFLDEMPCQSLFATLRNTRNMSKQCYHSQIY